MDTREGVASTAGRDLRSEIHETRRALGDKLEGLEGHLQHLSGAVKGRVRELQDTLDVRQQITRHPFAAVMVGLLSGIVVGVVVGWRVSRRASPYSPEVRASLAKKPMIAGVAGAQHEGFVQNIIRSAVSDAVPLLLQVGREYLLGGRAQGDRAPQHPD